MLRRKSRMDVAWRGHMAFIFTRYHWENRIGIQKKPERDDRNTARWNNVNIEDNKSLEIEGLCTLFSCINVWFCRCLCTKIGAQALIESPSPQGFNKSEGKNEKKNAWTLLLHKLIHVLRLFHISVIVFV
jgi:hypothetical protein